MIKESTYIRSFTASQKKQMEEVAEQQSLKSVPCILFFALEQYLEQQKEIARLNRLIAYKQAKIERITGVENVEN